MRIEYNGNHMSTLNLATLGSDYRAGYWRQMVTVLWRSYIVFVRNPGFLRDRFITMLWMTILFGLFYYGKGYDYSITNDINGALNMILQTFVMTQSILTLMALVGEEAVLCREHHNRTYALFPYILATIILQVMYRLMISTLCPDLSIANAILGAVIQPLLILGGYFINSGTLPGWLVWANYQSVLVNEWQNVGNMSSANTTNTTQSTTTYTSGVDVIESMGFDESALMWCPIALIVWALVYMCIAYIGLCRKVQHK
ncbi:unnamed protein product [Oppiella nova]|uniref:ABC-2 type transporter transmembrane domain-containing protein n=1 Tax=Oppiella nova TaxID=334625 RepID=A0A7R9M9W8_9ACAR|nr:unnamed protein product [Oppiella nova]CAG2173464.1 unnamed protein product [Oppiella nova]